MVLWALLPSTQAERWRLPLRPGDSQTSRYACPPTRAAAPLCTAFTVYPCVRSRVMSTALRGSESV